MNSDMLLSFETGRVKQELGRKSRPNFRLFVPLKIGEGWTKCLREFFFPEQDMTSDALLIRGQGERALRDLERCAVTAM